jgi:Ca2+-binding EF-hand superfamily protein
LSFAARRSILGTMPHLLSGFALLAAGLVLVPPTGAALQRGRGAVNAGTPANKAEKPPGPRGNVSAGTPANKTPQPERGPAAGRGAGRGAGESTGADAGDSERRPRVDLAGRYFELSDADRNGWISFREARDALGVEDPAAFSVFDRNGDGMCEEHEFRARYDAVLARGGAFRPPRTADPLTLAGGYTVTALIELYDASGDERLDRREVLRAFVAQGFFDLDGQRVIEDLDADGSGRLEGSEIEALGPLFEGGWKRYEEAAPTSLAELFGRPEPRIEDEEGFVIEPPLIVGPVHAFRRLDLDDDGGITLFDLEELRRPLRPPVRLEAVMAVLDANADGRIDADELRASMTRPR